MRKQPIQTSRSKKKYKEHKLSCGKCKICHPESQTLALPWMVETMLARKYSKSSTDSTNVSQFQGFINELSIRFRGGLPQFLVEFPVITECMHKFYKISEIRQTITSVIKSSSSQFSPNIMHFHPPFYRIILRSQSREERLNLKLKKESHRTPCTKFNFKLDLCNNSFIKAKKSKKKVLPQNNKNTNKIQPLNQSLLEIKKLCQKIGIMCKSENEKGVKKFKQQLESAVNRKSQQKDLQQRKFKYNLDDNFSIIRKNPSTSKQKHKKQENKCHEVEQIYGISDKKSKKKTVLRQHQSRILEQSSGRGGYYEKRASTQKIQLVPDSPVSQAYYTKQFNYTEVAGPIKPKRRFKLHGSCSKSKERQNSNAYLQNSKSWKVIGKRSLGKIQQYSQSNPNLNINKKCESIKSGLGFRKIG